MNHPKNQSQFAGSILAGVLLAFLMLPGASWGVYQTNVKEPGFKEIEFDAVITDNTPDPCDGCECESNNPQWFSDWTGQYYETYEEFAENSTVSVWSSNGPQVVISKRELIRQAGLFGVIISGILVLALYLAVL